MDLSGARWRPFQPYHQAAASPSPDRGGFAWAGPRRTSGGRSGARWPYHLLGDAAGGAPDTLPAEDTELSLTFAVGVVACRADPGTHLDASGASSVIMAVNFEVG